MTFLTLIDYYNVFFVSQIKITLAEISLLEKHATESGMEDLKVDRRTGTVRRKQHKSQNSTWGTYIMNEGSCTEDSMWEDEDMTTSPIHRLYADKGNAGGSKADSPAKEKGKREGHCTPAAKDHGNKKEMLEVQASS